MDPFLLTSTFEFFLVEDRLDCCAEKNEFVEGLKNIVDEYGFDGIDLDFEGGSMDFGAGALTDFSYEGISAFQKLKNVVDAFKEIKQYYGSNFILTAKSI